MTELREQSVTFSRWTVLLAAAMACAAMLACLFGDAMACLASAATFIPEGGLAGLVFLAAAGYGHLILRRLAPPGTPAGLRVATSCILGLWMLSTLILLAGSLFHGLLKPYFWWPVIGLGLLAGVIQARHVLGSWKFSTSTDLRSLLWVVLAAAGAFWMAGATLPAGWTGRGTCDFYDVLEYHLQLPREYYNAQHIASLPHNCYSFYPLGTEMLYLLAMCLRNGAYEGMYAANAIPGCFTLLAVLGVFSALRSESETRARFCAALLGTTPFVLYLSGLAMAETAMLACLTLALLWLRQWLAAPSLRGGLCIGLTAGAALAIKYLSAGFIAGPVLAAMFIAACLKTPRMKRIGQALASAAIALLLFSPWLIRNAATTGNPVFPLATQIMGGAHWSSECRQRWEDGHGPQTKPPVPPPASWKLPEHTDWPVTLVQDFVLSPMYSPLLTLLGLAAAILVLLRDASRNVWNCCLLGVLIVQTIVWLTCTHQSPSRFIVPAVVPLALLCGELLTALADVKHNPLKGASVPNALPGANFSQARTGRPWGFTPAITLLAVTLAVNLFLAWGVFGYTTSLILPGAPAWELTWRKELARSKNVQVGDQARFLLVGQAECFYFPPNTLYATVFDANPLVNISSRCQTPQELLAQLKQHGITHLWVNWAEIVRLANTYGYPAAIGNDVMRRFVAHEPPGFAILDSLIPLGLVRVCEFSSLATQGTSQPAWPIITVYAIP